LSSNISVWKQKYFAFSNEGRILGLGETRAIFSFLKNKKNSGIAAA
jgi:hypothetical protein